MSGELISVVVPVYNGEKFVKRCVERIAAQTYKNTEIILVDDGSSDASGKIADELSSRIKNVFAVHIPHGGVSCARNAGIDKSRGKYITFTDCDDEPKPDMLEKMVDALERGGSQLAVVGIERVNGEESVFEPYDAREITVIDNAARLYMKPMYFNSSSNKLYISEIIKKNNIRFEDGVYIGEDFLFNAEYARFAEKTAVISLPLYTYNISGATIAPSSDARRFEFIGKMYYSITALAKDDAELIKCIKMKIFDEYILAFRVFCMSGARFRDKVREVKRVMRSAEYNAVRAAGTFPAGMYGRALHTNSAAAVCAYFEITSRRTSEQV